MIICKIMKVLKAPTYYLKKKIESLTKGNYLIKFTKDANDNWIVGKQILNDPKFEHIKSEFAHLEEIDYNPIVEDEI